MTWPLYRRDVVKFKARIGSDEDEYAVFFSEDGDPPRRQPLPRFMVYVCAYPPALLDKNGDFPQTIEVEVTAP